MKKFKVRYKMDELPKWATISAKNSQEAIDKVSNLLAKKYGSYPLSIYVEDAKKEDE